ncbi:MAG: AraC family transcriptional regulator [Ketobacteraceae bacterium]|nr:AraC family transcriptional regulator [Ketobacteraceae bacterium]
MKANTVSAAYLRGLLIRAEQAGMDPLQLLASRDIPPSLVQEPNARIASEHYVSIAHDIMSRVRDEFLLLGGVRRTPAGAFAMMTHSVIHCRTLKRALLMATRFYNLFLDDLQFRVSRQADQVQIAVRWRDPATDWDHGTTDGCLVLIHRFFSWLCGQRISLTEVRLSLPVPENSDEYHTLFRCPLQFNQPIDALVFPAKLLDLPVMQTETSLKAFLREAPGNLIVIPDNDNSVTAQVRSLIGKDFSQEFPDFESVARAFNTTPQTLRRRLKQENSSYQEIKDTMRRDAAIYYLSRSRYTINEIAELMGFSEPSTFHRAFKKWTGLTPGNYRLHTAQDR